MKSKPNDPCTLAAAAAFFLLTGALATSALAGYGGSSAEYKEAESAAFAEADANHDGSLTETELSTFHDVMRKKVNALHFDKFDADDNGLVSLEELQNARKAGHHCGEHGAHHGGS